MVAVPAVALLYAASVPGFHLVLAVAAGWALVAGAVVWTIRGVVHVVDRRRGRAGGNPIWFLVAPLGGLVVAGLLVLEAPFHLRWLLSRPAFEEAVEAVHGDTPGAGSGVRIPGRVGLYHVVGTRIDGRGVFFYERTGRFLDDAGFAHLPDGPASASWSGDLELRALRPLGGDWYGWTASW